MAATYQELRDLVETLARGNTEVSHLENEARVLLARKDKTIDVCHDVDLGDAETVGMTGGQAAALVASGYLRHKRTTVVIDYQLVNKTKAALVAEWLAGDDVEALVEGDEAEG